MRRVVNKFLTSLVVVVFVDILLALVLSGVFWFFASVIFGAGWTFAIVWKWLYLVLVLYGLIINLKKAIRRAALITKLSKKWDVTKDKAYTALYDYGFDKRFQETEAEIEDLTPEEFERLFSNAESLRELAKGITEAMGL